MNWKKTLLFIFLLLVSIALFGFPLLFSLFNRLFLVIFFILVVVLLSLLFKKYSKTKLIIMVAIIILYLAIIVIPFPKCDTFSSWEESRTEQQCTCIGIKKYIRMMDAEWTECVGIPINYRTIPTEIPPRYKNNPIIDVTKIIQ